MDAKQKEFMDQAIRLSLHNVKSNEGAPFGAVIVKEDKIIGEGANRVISTNDPTAHAEIVAIRNACKKLGTFELRGCEIYASCEPCPMCLGAIYWARLSTIYYANTKGDAAKIGFDDSFIYEQLELPPQERSIPMIRLELEEAKQAFRAWEQSTVKIPY